MTSMIRSSIVAFAIALGSGALLPAAAEERSAGEAHYEAWKEAWDSGDRPRALSELGASCDAAFARGCAALGLVLYHGLADEVDEVVAFGYFLRGCELGDVAACNAVRAMLLTEGLNAHHYEQARTLIEGRCTAGVMGACSDLGFIFHRGLGVPADLSKAVAHYQVACDGGFAVACSNLGVLYAEGQGVAADPEHGVELLIRGCGGGDMAGCASLGHALFHGIGVAQDRDMAIRLFRMSCEADVEEGCNNLAYALRHD